MKSFYFSLLAALCFLLAMPAKAQSEKTMLIHFKDKTVKEIPVSQIDSINFSKAQGAQSFDIQLGDAHPLYYGFNVTPASNFTGTYNVMFLEKSEFLKYKSDEDVVADDIKYFRELTEGYGSDLSEILSFFLLDGPYTDFHTGLLPDTEYVMWVYGLSLNGEQTTPLHKVYFKTTKATHIPNKIAIDVKRTDNTIEVTYTPDDNNLHYTAGLIASKDALSESNVPHKMQQALSNQIVDYVLEEIPLTEYLQERTEKGQSKAVFNGINPSAKYFISAAYLDSECCLCSDVTVITSTPEGAKSVSTTPSVVAEKTSVKRHIPAKMQLRNLNK